MRKIYQQERILLIYMNGNLSQVASISGELKQLYVFGDYLSCGCIVSLLFSSPFFFFFFKSTDKIVFSGDNALARIFISPENYPHTLRSYHKSV